MKTSKERVASLLANFPNKAQELVDNVHYCDHVYIVVSKKKTISSEHATQVMCQKCMFVQSFEVICQINEDLTELFDILSPSGEFQTDAGS